MTTLTVDETHPEWTRADLFCTKHFGNSVRDLGYEDVVERAIAAGENVTVALEAVADEDGLDYLDGVWGHGKPGLAEEHACYEAGLQLQPA